MKTKIKLKNILLIMIVMISIIVEYTISIPNASAKSGWEWEELGICPSDINVNVGKTKSLGCVAEKNDPIKKYTSSNTSIVTVTQKGKITGKKVGTANITVITKKGEKETIKVKVKSSSSSTTSKSSNYEWGIIDLCDMKVKVTVGKTKSLGCVAEKNDPIISYKSSNTKIATVNSKGVVKGIKKGSTKVTVTTKKGEKQTVTINVVNKSTNSNNKSDGLVDDLDDDGIPSYEEEIDDGGATNTDISNPSDPSVNVVDMSDGDDHSASMQGEEGESFIYAKDISVVVSDPSDKYIRLAKKGSTKTIKASAVTTGSVPISSAVTCESKNPSVVSVGKTSCKVKAKKKSGTAVIIVRSKSYSYRLNAVQVVIGNSKPSDSDNSIMEYAVKYGEDISLCYETSYIKEKEEYDIPLFNSCIKMVNDANEVMKEGYAPKTNDSSNNTSNKYTCPSKISVQKGKTKTIKCTPAKGDKITKYKSNKTSVATVTQKGKVKGVKKGSAKITVTTKKGRKKTVKISVANKTTSKVTVKPAKKKKTATIKIDGTKKSKKKNVKVKSLTLNKSKVNIKMGESEKLKATVKPNNATNKNVTWKSNKTSVARVDSSGKVTALKEGTATITAKAGGKSKQCKVTVKPNTKYVAVREMALASKSRHMKVSETFKISPVFGPSNVTNKNVTWKSSDKKIVTVDEKGKITAKKVGTAIVTGTSLDNKNVKVNLNVYVEDKVKIESLSIVLKKATIAKNETVTAKIDTEPSNTTNKKATWKSSNTKVATVNSSGKIKGIKKGTATITATSKDNSKLSDKIKIKVENYGTAAIGVNTTNITLNKKEVTLKTSKSYKFSTQTIPKNTDEEIKWKSSDNNVAQVDKNGRVTAYKKGTATITAYIKGNAKVSDKATVTVIALEGNDGELELNPPVNSIKLDTTKLSIGIGQKYDFKVIIDPSSANKKLTWSTSDKKVATISSQGRLKAIKKGTATITVKSSNGKTSKCKVTVSDKLKAVAVEMGTINLNLNKYEFNLMSGDKDTIVATNSVISDGNDTVLYTSSNNNIVQVNGSGVLQAYEPGEAKINVYLKSNPKIKGTAKVTVTQKADENGNLLPIEQPPVKSIEITEAAVLLNKIGEQIQLTHTIMPTHANQLVVWTSSNPSVATVDENGVVTAISNGDVLINANSINGKTDYCSIIVLDGDQDANQVNSIKLSKSKLELEKGSSKELKATLTPKTATSKDIKWKSSDNKVVSVTQKGNVMAVGRGSATITAYSRKNPNVTATCKVTVFEVKYQSVLDDYDTNPDKNNTNREEIKEIDDTSVIPIDNLPSDNNKNNTNSNSSSSNKTTKKEKKTKIDKYIFTGDSRFVGMQINNKGSKDVYIAKSSEGLNYFKQNESKIKSIATKNSVLIIGFGINDLTNVDNYINYVNRLDVKGKIYYLTVNPVDEAVEQRNGYNVKNSTIDSFNKRLKSKAKNYTVIDTNAYLKKNGFKTGDGVHYDETTYKKIYDYVKKQVK